MWSTTSSTCVASAKMSSRSNGVMYCVFRSWISSRVIVSPSCSAALTSAWVTEAFGYSRKRRSISFAASSVLAPALEKRS